LLSCSPALVSGIGRELGQAGLEAYTELKTVTMSVA
jgi:acyl-CoA reductase-like NAD-dependent aldehyde dehydrogenase